MRRREFMTLLGGIAATSLARPASAQSMPEIGFLDSGAPANMKANLDAFRQGLAETGFIEGKNLAIEYRWAQGRYDQLPALAAGLVQRPVAVIAATRSSAPAKAAKGATATIPIVFQTGSDPVEDGLVGSLNKPGGNVTGATRLTTALTQKRLGLISELLPKTTTIAMLVNPNGPQTPLQISQMQEAARARNFKLEIVRAASQHELEGAFAGAAQGKVDALVVASDNLFITNGPEIARIMIRHAVPTMTFESGAVKAGVLISYAASLSESFQQVGTYVGRILKGEKPADLPVLQPTKFELVLNLKTAKAIRLAIPDKLMALADEVIE
jgi:putative ABC transport system substrate-binding protein